MLRIKEYYNPERRNERFLLLGNGSDARNQNLGASGALTISFCVLYSSEAILRLEGGRPSGALFKLINVPGLINVGSRACVMQSSTQLYCVVQGSSAEYKILNSTYDFRAIQNHARAVN